MVTSFPSEPVPPDPSDDGQPNPPLPSREPTPIDSARRSRLDREVDEILRSATRDAPLPPTPISSRRTKGPNGPSTHDRLRPILSTVVDTVMAVPLITAVGLGIVCAIVAPYSPFIATIAVVLAIVVLAAPYIRAARRSSLPGGDDPKMWRGRVMDSPSIRPRGIGERTPAEKITDWINSRRP
ncbi:MAG: hypothetical protein QM589_02265 [Thermomicrobiales bacterium]